MQLYGYACPDCGTYSRRVEGRETPEGVRIKCPECGAIEEIEQDCRDGERRELMADGGRHDEVRDPQLPEQTQEPEFRFVRIGERINVLLMLGLTGLYLTNSAVSWEALPGLTTAFPFAAGFALIVLTVGVGMDTGALPTVESRQESGNQ